MTQQMRDFIEKLKTVINGEVVTRNGHLALIDRDAHDVTYGPDPGICDPASYALFVARVERMLGMKGWDWT